MFADFNFPGLIVLSKKKTTPLSANSDTVIIFCCLNLLQAKARKNLKIFFVSGISDYFYSPSCFFSWFNSRPVLKPFTQHIFLNFKTFKLLSFRKLGHV